MFLYDCVTSINFLLFLVYSNFLDKSETIQQIANFIIFSKTSLFQKPPTSLNKFKLRKNICILAVKTRNTGHGKSYVPHLAFILYILSQFIRQTKKQTFRFCLFVQLEQPRELETNFFC